MPGRDAVRGPAALVLLTALAFLVLSAGCSVIVDEANKAADVGVRSTASAAAAPLPQYDVAISAVDLDPPLRQGAVLSPNQPFKLVAAVENRGSMPLSALQVQARFSSQQGDFSVQDQISLDRLSPGETRVVEFRRVGTVSSLPRSPSYSIIVSIDAPQMDSSRPKPTRELTVRVVDQ